MVRIEKKLMKEENLMAFAKDFLWGGATAALHWRHPTPLPAAVIKGRDT